MFLDENVERGGIVLAGVEDDWEGKLGALHSTLAVLEGVRGKVISTPTHSTSAPSGNHSNSGVVWALEEELRECREDLRRDEEIFGDKVAELSQLRWGERLVAALCVGSIHYLPRPRVLLACCIYFLSSIYYLPCCSGACCVSTKRIN